MDTVLYFHSQSKTSSGDKLAGVQEIAEKCGWLVQTVDGVPDGKRLKALIEFWNPVGAIVECGGSGATVNPSVFGPLPVVFLDHDPSCLPKGAFSVVHDSTATAQMAAKELMRGNAESFAFVPYPERRFWSEQRERGFTDALSLNGRTCRVFAGRKSPTDPTQYQRELRSFVEKLPKPCSVFAANDKTAAEVLTAAAFAGVRVPEDIAVVGVDDAEDICEHTSPTLTSVRPDFRRGGCLAALLLVARIRDRASFRGPRQRTFGPLQVVRRASTRMLASHDRAVSDALELIRRKACRGLTAREVLSKFPCARRQAEMRFRKATGRSVLDEILSVRLDRAKTLLEDPRQSLKPMADFCGFRNENSMRKFFKRLTGMSMSEWRRESSARRIPAH